MTAHTPGRSPLGDVIRQVRQCRSAVRLLPPGPPGHKLAQHPPLRGPAMHGVFELAICCSGRMTLVGATRMFDLRHGDVVVIAPGAWHYESYDRPVRPYRFCWIVVTPGRLRCNFTTYDHGQLDVFWLRGDFPGGQHHAICAELIRRVQAKQTRDAASTRRLVLELLTGMQHNAARLKQPPAPVAFEPLDKLLKIIEARFREPLRIRTLARDVGLSPNYLSSQFRQAVGTTFANHVNILRVWHAQLLIEHDWPLKRIATECGFRNVHYFTTVFTRKCRMTPGAFRRTCSRPVSRDAPGSAAPCSVAPRAG